MKVDDLFELRCQRKGCTAKAKFICPMCQTFLYCSNGCRKRSHNVRKCPKSTYTHSVNAVSIVEKIYLATKDLDRLETERRTTEILFEVDERPNSAAHFALITAQMMHETYPGLTDQLRAVCLFPFKCFLYKWKPEMWKAYVEQYFTSLALFGDIVEFEFAIEFGRMFRKLYKQKTPIDPCYVLVCSTMAEVLNIFGWIGKDVKEAEIRKNIRVGRDFDAPNSKAHAKYAIAKTEFTFSKKGLREALKTFVETCDAIVVEEVYPELHAKICIELANAYDFLGDTEQAMIRAQLTMANTIDAGTAELVLCAFTGPAVVTDPQVAEDIARSYLDNKTTSSLPGVMGFMSASLARILVDTEEALDMYAQAYVYFKADGKLGYALEVLSELFGVYESKGDLDNLVKVGELILVTFESIRYDACTGFYHFRIFEQATKGLMVAAYEQRRVDDAWVYAAMYSNACDVWNAWQCPELDDIRDYAHKEALTCQTLLETQTSKIIESYAKRHRISLPAASRSRQFGAKKGAHAAFVNRVGLVDQVDEKSYAFVWIETVDDVYAFVVHTDGVISVRRKPRERVSGAALVPSMARSLSRVDGRETSLALVHAPEKGLARCKALDGVCVWSV